ncbi:MAG TPA: UPF0179 family protein [Methanoregulaceae archaeon]|nr:UPF0179 family protein [Methanoregulaceae archaeon]
MGARKNAVPRVKQASGSKPKITLIGTDLARTGLEFVYEGILEECGACSLRKACNNLKEGRRYRITSIRPAHHDCTVHRNGTSTVEVIESPVGTLINAEMAIKNSRITYEFSCTNETCKNYDLCHPEGIVAGEKYTVVDITGSAPEPCEKGRTLQVVNLIPV